MSTVLLTTVPDWVWQTTTLVTVAVTGVLIAILTLHVIIAAVAAQPEGRSERSPVLHRLTVAAIPLLVCLVAVVAARFVIIFIERPGR